MSVTKFNFMSSVGFLFNSREIVFKDDGAQLIGDQFPTDNPFVVPADSFAATKINNLITDITAQDPDAIKHTIEVNGAQMFWDTDKGVWSVSSGYDQSNTLQEINGNIKTLIAGFSRIRLFTYFHSETGQSTPVIRVAAFDYDVPSANKCVIRAQIESVLGAPPDSVKDLKLVVENPEPGFFIGNMFVGPFGVEEPFEADGTLTVELIQTKSIGKKFNFFIAFTDNGGPHKISLGSGVIPNQNKADLSEILGG